MAVVPVLAGHGGNDEDEASGLTPDVPYIDYNSLSRCLAATACPATHEIAVVLDAILLLPKAEVTAKDALSVRWAQSSLPST